MKLHPSSRRSSLALLLCAAFLCTLCACGKQTAPPSEQAAQSADPIITASSAEPAGEGSASAGGSAVEPIAPESSAAPEEGTPEQEESPLSLWREGSKAKAELLEYVESVTREGSEDYIPEAERIAVFDVDGTLFCETDPIFFDWAMFAHRALDDDTFDSTEEQRDVARRILDAGESGKVPGGLGEEQARLNASLYAGMTLEEFAAYTRSWLEQDAPGYEGMTRGEAFYRPMLELVDYLEDKGFTVYACSGSDRFAVRVLLEGVLEPRQVIGTDVKLVAEGQGDEDGQFYVYSEGERLLRGERLLVKNGKMNKVSALMREIGVKPVLCFGNAAGDESMAAFVTSDNPHRSMACFVLCDDTERERGNLEKAEKIRTLCREHGWGTISMGEDWETIYGPGVTKR